MILLVRGDLQSETGWSRATRALLAAIADRFSTILGIDLHYHPARSFVRFPYALVDPHTVATYTPLMSDLVVLHACQPDCIEWMPGAINVGWWFWETDQIQSDFDWKERLETLDILFVPSDWHASWAAAHDIRTPIEVLPWPFDLKNMRLPAQTEYVGAYRLFDRHAQTLLSKDSELGTNDRLAILSQQAESCRIGPGADNSYVISVQSDAPRKGLACLLSEWHNYRRFGGKLNRLLIRFSGLDVNHDESTLLATLSRIALIACRGDEAAFSDVRAIVDHVPDEALYSAYAGAAAMIAPTFGEGFGGTIVEAVQACTLVIAPRHTACNQLLPAGYPLAYKSLPYIGALIGQSSMIPSNSTWHLPQPGAIAKGLALLDGMSAEDKSDALENLSSHLQQFLAPERIANIFFQAIVRVQQVQCMT